MLTLPIKKKWFDMIASGEKKEEYREIKPYYTARFKKIFRAYPVGENRATIMFRNGYSAKSPTIEAECMLKKGQGKPEWGAEEGREYYVLVILSLVIRTVNDKSAKDGDDNDSN